MTDTHTHWNKTAARVYIESKQDPDGAFTDPGLTADVLMALTHKGLGAIRNFDCGRGDTDYENHGKKTRKNTGSMRILLDGYVVVWHSSHPPSFFFISFLFFFQTISMLSV